MTTKQIIQKIIFIGLTLTACSGLVVLLVAAIGRRNHEKCRDYVITINGAQRNLFINQKDIQKLLDSASGGNVKNRPITDFNLRKLEKQLKQNAWVRDADLYFDNKDVLHVSVQEREPVARIFTSGQRSYYIDSSAERMPLSDIMSASVPVFTNFPDKKFLGRKDSTLLGGIVKTATFILNDPFWMAQTEQIDITPDRNFELVPTVGNHIVKLGNGDDIDMKFHRLLVFYQQVLSETSFDKYKFIDVRYAGQVTGTREKITKVDSVQLRKNVEKLLLEARRMQQDTTMFMHVMSTKEPGDGERNSAANKAGSNPVSARDENNSNPTRATTTKPKLIVNKAEEKPKAVVPEKN